MAARSARRKPDLQVVVSDGAPRFSGVEIAEDPTEDLADQQTIESPDGSVTITIGTTEAPEPPAQPDDNFNSNLAERMDPGALQAIAGYLLDSIDADLQSRKDWEDTANRAADYLGVKLNDPTTDVSADGTVCKSIATSLLEANLKLWGVARGELLPVGGPVKCRRDGQSNQAPVNPMQMGTQAGPKPVPAGIAQSQGGIGAAANDQQTPTLDDLAAALENDMNHFLTVIDRQYYPDFSKMLFSRALIGNAFRKVYWDPMTRRPTSVWVKAQDMIVSNDCMHLSGAGRITERIRLRQSVMRRLQVMGHYLDIPLTQPTGQATDTEMAVGELEGILAVPQLPEDFEHQVYECYCELGSTARNSLIGNLSALDRDEAGKKVGYPLPYRVSIDMDSRAILEIRRNWRTGDTEHRSRQRYVKYGFIPGLGFWDFGLIHIVGNPTQTATMIQRATVDATLYANFPGGVFGKGVGSRQTNTVIRPNPGQFIGMEMGGASKIQDMLMPLPYRQPSGEEIGLISKMEGDARRLAGVIELPIGDGRSANIPVGTIMAYLESVTQVPGAVHKDDHITQQQEFELLRELFAENPESLITGNRSPARRWQVQDELMQPDIVPAADPNTPSQVHRLMKLQGMVAIGGMPQFQGISNNRKIYEEVMRFLSGGDPSEYTLPAKAPAPAAPPPQVIAAQIRAQSQGESDQAKVLVARENNDAKSAQAASDAINAELDRQSEEARAALKANTDSVKAVGDLAAGDADRAQDHAHHVDGLNTPAPQPQQGGNGPGFTSPF